MTKFSKKILFTLITVGIGSVILTDPAYANQFIKQAEQLAKIRSEISDLLFQIQMEKSTHQNRMQSLEGQVSDLELQIRREKVQITQIDEQITKIKSEMQNAQNTTLLSEYLYEMGDKIKSDIQNSLPYHQEERISSVDEILKKFASKELSEQQAANRLWSILEDEERLNRENIVDNAKIELNGKQFYVEIVRLGMMTMFFQSPDGKVGYIESRGENWIWVEQKDPQSKQNIQQLFTEMKKGIRNGFFELPLSEYGVEK